ncbi:Acg family FMN-binding oxidoreductase [Actinomadura atramentaria]|uniref:Acg family FMN-binding oxidoreductase n=1 Tax=Actinomadura atramentaria TaxID=1990 RepID=UPI00036FE4B8|nr:hypothetical protein [Actinomadura atramentaria]
MDTAETGTALARRIAAAALWAPSVHNTQPWTFGLADDRVVLRADAARRLSAADPVGRELVISCGAALFTAETALRVHGRDPRTALLPDPDRPNLLAEVVFGGAVAAGEAAAAARLLAKVPRRRAHRTAFRAVPVPPRAVERLRAEAGREGVRLAPVTDEHAVAALAALTRAAEHVQHLDAAHAAETARWASRPGADRRDGVPAAAYPREAPRTDPDFAARDFARGRGWGTGASAGESAVGTVLTLSTPGDDRADWLRAGRALQRVLLHAAEAGLAAAFHTQALEVPELRAFIRTRFCDGEYPQLVLRLGVPDGTGPAGVRRPVEDVVIPEP